MNNNTINVTIAIFLSVAVLSSALISNDDTGKLGPADALVLSGTESDMTVTNKEGRMSWGDEQTSTVWSIAFMETGKALQQLLKADHFNEARADLNAEIKENISDTREALDVITEEAKQLTPEDPNFGDVRQQWQQLYEKFQHLQQLGADARGALYAEQMQEAYKEIIEAVNVVAERMNIDMVLRFIPAEEDFEQGNPDSIIMQIRLRSALRTPDSLDITDEVLVELGLDD
jgi:Skp family chaperone for outer membrane proteins